MIAKFRDGIVVKISRKHNPKVVTLFMIKIGGPLITKIYIDKQNVYGMIKLYKPKPN